MELTREQQAILDGAQGDTMAKIMKTLVMYGETFGATKNGAGNQQKRTFSNQLWFGCNEAYL